VVKGINKRAVIIRPSDKGIFEEAIFIVRGEALGEKGLTADDIIREACRAADSYMKNSGAKQCGLSRIPPPLFMFVGAAVTAVAWLITSLL
jgi:RNA 3'-terminal phosphate cyclase